MVLDEIVEFIQNHDDPGVTISEVANNFDELDRDQVKYRMKKLVEQDRICKKRTGASSAIWFPKA